MRVGDTVLPLEDPGASPSILIDLLHVGLPWILLRAKCEGIHQKVDIAGRVEDSGVRRMSGLACSELVDSGIDASC